MNFNTHLFDETVVLRKNLKKNESMNNNIRNGNVVIQKKQVYKNENIKAIDEYNDAGRHNTVELSLSKIISKARLAKGLSQKDLAQKINQKPSIIIEYESGKAIPNPKILGMMERHLGVKLRGKKALLGTPLGK